MSCSIRFADSMIIFILVGCLLQAGNNQAAPNAHTLAARAVSDNIADAVPDYLRNAANRVRSTVKNASNMARDAAGEAGENLSSFLRNTGSTAFDFSSNPTKSVENVIKSGSQAAQRLSSLYRQLFDGINGAATSATTS